MSSAAAHAIDVFRRSRDRFSVRTISLAGLSVYVVATILLISGDGIPLSRDVVFAWILVGMLAVSLADLRGWARGVIFDWLPFFALLFAYDFLRGQIGSDPLFTPHLLPQIHADEFLFGSIPSVDLQHRLFDPGNIGWLDIASWGVYVTHFFTVFLIAATLWRISRPLFLEFRAMVLTLTAAAFITYTLFPAAPPWMAGEDGAIEPVHRIVGEVWRYLGVGSAAAIWDHGSAFSNQVAAIPSLHTAYPVLILCFFWRYGWPARAICLFYAFAMSFALVYTGEHYVFDILLGWAYAITAFVAVGAIRRAWARRSERIEPIGGMQDPSPAPRPAAGPPLD